MECQTITTVPEVNKILVIVGPSGVGKRHSYEKSSC